MTYFVARGEHRRLDSAARAKLRGSFAQCSDGITHYELAGPETGDLVLLVGGMTIPLFYWDRFADELHQQGFRTLAVSGYGRGYSDRVQGVYDEALFVRQLDELIDGLQLAGPWHVVGTSMGALVAMVFTDQHIEQTTTLTLVGPAGLEPKLPMFGRLLRHPQLRVLLGKYLGQKLLQKHLSHNVRDLDLSATLSDMVRACYEYEGSIYSLVSTLADFPITARQGLYAATAQLPVPSLLVWGDEDQVTPISRLHEVRELLAPDDYHIIKNCGHMAPYERPAEVAKKFGEFVHRTMTKA